MKVPPSFKESNIVGALCHEIRTPLSVIINDLTYLQTILPPDECSRALRKTWEIKEILKRYSDIAGGSNEIG